MHSYKAYQLLHYVQQNIFHKNNDNKRLGLSMITVCIAIGMF